MPLRRPFQVMFILGQMLTLAACNLPGASAPAVASPAGTEPVPELVGQCVNPLQPVMVGAQWTYSLSGISTGSFTRSITALRSDGFTEQDQFDGGLTRIGEWKCENGTLTALSPAESLSAMIQTEGMQAEFRTTSSSGVTLPAIVRPGDSWSQTFKIEGTQSVAGQDVQGKGDIAYSCTAADIETVVVPAGSFDAMRVGCQINGTITVTLAGLEVPTQLASVATIWYARDVGMVKTENEIGGVGHSSVELTAYTIQ